jgi:hypothetical protein
MRIGTWLLVAVAVVCLTVLAGCGGGDNNGGGKPPAVGGTVTGEIYARSGGTFVALGGQTASIGTRTATSQPGTGRFTITNVPAGAFTVVITPQPGFGEVLNSDILDGTVAVGQTVDIGRVLLGQKPPNPGV